MCTLCLLLCQVASVRKYAALFKETAACFSSLTLACGLSTWNMLITIYLRVTYAIYPISICHVLTALSGNTLLIDGWYGYHARSGLSSIPINRSHYLCCREFVQLIITEYTALLRPLYTELIITVSPNWSEGRTNWTYYRVNWTCPNVWQVIYWATHL